MIIVNHDQWFFSFDEDQADRIIFILIIIVDSKRSELDGWSLKREGALVSDGGLSHGWSTGPTQDGTLGHTVTPRLKPHK